MHDMNTNNKNISSSLNNLNESNKNKPNVAHTGNSNNRNVHFIPTSPTSLSASALIYNQIKTSFAENFHTYQSTSRESQFEYKCRSFQSYVYNFLERPHGTWGFLFRCLAFLSVLTSILLSAFTTLSPISLWSKWVIYWFECTLATCFFIKFCIRVWSSGHRVPYQGLVGRLKFISHPIVLIELVVFILTAFILTFGWFNFNGDILITPTALTLLRFVQLARLLNVDRKAQTWNLLADVVHKHRFELITSIYIGFIILLLSSYLILIFEKPFSIKNNDDQFHSYSDALYYSIITMTTIGYGDRTPRTFYGKLIATSLCILGVAFWTLPGGIIGSGLALKVEQKNKKKQFNRLVPAAACLIQSHWRMKAVLNICPERLAATVATLKVFSVKRRMGAHVRTYSEPVRSVNDELNEIHENLLEDERDRQTKEFINQYLDPKHLVLIRTILIMKFYAARRKFKLAHKPYDFKDVIEQYTQGNMDILIKIKELQRKLDNVSNFQRHSATISKNFDAGLEYIRSNSSPRSYDQQNQISSLANKIDLVEEKLSSIEAKFNLMFQALKPQNE